MRIVVTFEGSIPDYTSNFSSIRYIYDEATDVQYLTIDNYGHSVSFDFDSVYGFKIQA